VTDGRKSLRGIVIISSAICVEYRSIGVKSKASVKSIMKLVRITKLPQKKLFEVLRKSFIKEKKEKDAVTIRMKILYLSDIITLQKNSNLYYTVFFNIIIKRF
jgi:hypothetical protein